MNRPRHTPAHRQHGGTLGGFLVGLLIGLGAAVAVAVFMTQTPLPFVDKVKRPALAEPGRSGELPDPNRNGARTRATPTESVPGDPSSSRPVASAEPTAASQPAATGSSAPAPAPAPGSAAPAASPAPAASAAPTSAEPVSYLLQAGAFRGQEDADAMKVKLALIGFEARIVTAEVNDATFYRVRVGPFSQLEDMNRARSRLAENGIEASVVRQR